MSVTPSRSTERPLEQKTPHAAPPSDRSRRTQAAASAINQTPNYLAQTAASKGRSLRAKSPPAAAKPTPPPSSSSRATKTMPRKSPASRPTFDNNVFTDPNTLPISFQRSGEESSISEAAIRRMMLESINEAKELMATGGSYESLVIPPSRPASPPLPTNSPSPTPDTSPKYEVKTINAATLNAFFADKVSPSSHEQTDSNPTLSVNHLVTITQILPTPEEIANLNLTPQEIEKVKTLDLFLTNITDEQLQALVQKFSSLTVIKLSNCPNLTKEGILNLPLNQLEVFELSTDVLIDESVTQKLATSPLLQRAEFSLCSKLSADGLLAFKNARTDFSIQIGIKWCDQIQREVVEQLRSARSENPILVEYTAHETDPVKNAFSHKLCPPPEIPAADDILTFDSIRQKFNSGGVNLPHLSVIQELEYSEPVRGIDLTGLCSCDFLETLLEKFPTLDIIRIIDNKQLSYLTMLKHQLKAKTLYLGNLSGVTPKRVEQLFTTPQDPKSWQELTDLHLYAIPTSDEALRLISALPRLTNLTLASCDSFTVQGFNHLRNGCPSLANLTIVDCPIDQFAFDSFEINRPTVKLITEEKEALIDLDASSFAIELANQIMQSDGPEKNLFFYPEESAVSDSPLSTIPNFYEKQLARIGVPFTALEQDASIPFQPLKADLTLQAYINIHRTCWAILKELIRLGFFLNVEKAKTPSSVKQILQSLTQIDEATKQLASKVPQKEEEKTAQPFTKGQIPVEVKAERTYGSKIRSLDLSNLGITFIPSFILELLPNLRMSAIKLDGNPIRAEQSPTETL
jgi:hypothetical protein